MAKEKKKKKIKIIQNSLPESGSNDISMRMTTNQNKKLIKIVRIIIIQKIMKQIKTQKMKKKFINNLIMIMKKIKKKLWKKQN